MTNECVICYQVFSGQSNKVYCSNACKQRAYRLNLTTPKQKKPSEIDLYEMGIQAYAAFAFKLLQIKKEKGVFYEDIKVLEKQIERVEKLVIQNVKVIEMHEHGQMLFDLASQIRNISSKQKDEQGFTYIKLDPKHIKELKKIIRYSWHQ